MFRKFCNCLLIVAVVTIGLNFHQKNSLTVYATSLEITGKIGVDGDKKKPASGESEHKEPDSPLAKPKAEKIFLKKYPATGMGKNSFFLIGIAIIGLAYLAKKSRKE